MIILEPEVPFAGFDRCEALPADLANLLNEAALIAASRSENEVTMADIEDAKDKIFMGKARKTMVQTPEEKKDTAYHEAGHVVVGLCSEYADPVHKAVGLSHAGWRGTVGRIARAAIEQM